MLFLKIKLLLCFCPMGELFFKQMPIFSSPGAKTTPKRLADPPRGPHQQTPWSSIIPILVRLNFNSLHCFILNSYIISIVGVKSTCYRENAWHAGKFLICPQHWWKCFINVSLCGILLGLLLFLSTPMRHAGCSVIFFLNFSVKLHVRNDSFENQCGRYAIRWRVWFMEISFEISKVHFKII